ncbi:MAG TPA: response regulator, partial [Candidatus Kryptonia bacterium]|nr:response regulator [Candidatus Kryptonia bacterium]
MTIKRALVVDDSKAAGLALRRMLEQHSVAVDLADSGEAALTYLKTQLPDVIFMDHIMPGLNGLEAAKAITGDPKTAAVPIVMYTSTEGDSYLDKAKAHGAVGILPKPPKPAALAQWIHQLGGTPLKPASAPAAPALASAAPSVTHPPVALSAEAIETLARGAAESVVRSATQTLIVRSMEEHLPQVRQDILARCETIAKQVAAEFLHARVTEIGNQLRAVQDQLGQLAERPTESGGGTAALHAEIETLARAVAEHAANEAANRTAQTVALKTAGDAAVRVASETARRVAAEVVEARTAPIADQLRTEFKSELAEIGARRPESATVPPGVLEEITASIRAAATDAAAETATKSATQVAARIAREAAQAAAGEAATSAATDAARRVADEIFASRSAALVDQLKREVAAQVADAGVRAGAPATALAPEVLEELKSITRHIAGQRVSESAHKAV